MSERDAPRYLPTLEEIEAEKAKIQEGWDYATRDSRIRGWGYDIDTRPPKVYRLPSSLIMD